MAVSRRTFMKTAGISGVGLLSAPLIAARGSEAAHAPELAHSELPLSPFASETRAAYRIAAPSALRLDSNENPNGPGRAALDAIRAMFDESDRKSTRLNSSHSQISYAVFCLKKKKK